MPNDVADVRYCILQQNGYRCVIRLVGETNNIGSVPRVVRNLPGSTGIYGDGLYAGIHNSVVLYCLPDGLAGLRSLSIPSPLSLPPGVRNAAVYNY